MYGHFITWDIAAMEWFHYGAGLSFLARASRWDVEGYPLCPCEPSLRMGSRRAQKGSSDRVLLGDPVHPLGERYVRECTPVPFHYLCQMMVVQGGLGVRVGGCIGAVCLANGMSGAVGLGLVAIISILFLLFVCNDA